MKGSLSSKENTSVFLQRSSSSLRRKTWKIRLSSGRMSMLEVTVVVVVVSFLSLFGRPQGSHGLVLVSTTGEGMKVWRQNTNFGNVRNWEGLVNGNCSRNIFSFPGWMDFSVVAFPSTFIGKQIILPVNGHFVFQPGLTTLSDSGTCQHGREVKFRRTSRADWFDSNNWLINDTVKGETISNAAVPHVERVPCQFDSVKFPSKSTFNLIISQKVTIGKFFLEDKEQSYTDIAVMMNSKLGKLQFQKAAEIEFTLTKSPCSDDDQCICDNYKREIRQKICSLSQCQSDVEEKCHNAILPHGFCCPICGFHIKIKHKGELKLQNVLKKIKSLVTDSPTDGIQFHLSRYQVRGAHIIIIPLKNSTSRGVTTLSKILAYLRSEPQVEEVTWNGSWEDIPSEVDKWASEGLNGGYISLIVIFILSLLIGLVCFIFYHKKRTYPPFSLSSISNMIPNFKMPNINMPNINIPLPGRSGSTVTSGASTFGFARFTNERVSTVNIERSAAGTLERAEQVDETINPIDCSSISLEKVTDPSPDFGFTTVTYDIIGVTDDFSTTSAMTMNNAIELVSPLEAESDYPSSQSFASASTSGNEKSSISENKTKTKKTSTGKQGRGPAKPTRAFNKENNYEPIYDEVCDQITDDKSAILQPQADFMSDEPEE